MSNNALNHLNPRRFHFVNSISPLPHPNHRSDPNSLPRPSQNQHLYPYSLSSSDSHSDSPDDSDSHPNPPTQLHDPLLHHDPDSDTTLGPFNIAHVPLHLFATDTYDQHDINDAIMRTTRPDHNNPDYDAQFRATRIQHVPLSTLKRYFDHGNTLHAIHLLQSRRSITIDPHFLVDVNDLDVVPFFDGHFIDFSLYLGSRLGLDAILPNPLLAQDHTWHIQFTFARLFKLWPDTHTQLPFSTTGRMMYIGARGQEEIWLAFVPNSLLNHPAPPDHPDPHVPQAPLDMSPVHGTTSSSLSVNHAYMVVMFFASLFTTLRFQDVHCNEEYPDPISFQSVNRATNVMGRLDERNRTFQLTLRDASANTMATLGRRCSQFLETRLVLFHRQQFSCRSHHEVRSKSTHMFFSPR
ncbi:hypothetical protein JVU11DRAFT_11408 [Chiua virens]|nr:hypothetical protein JVU11DRAFT_11408 [Chiua virens]